MGKLSLMAMASSGRLQAEPLAGQKIVHGHVLMSPPCERALAYGRFAQRAAPSIEVLEGPAHAEIAGGTDIATAEVPGERVEIQLARLDLARQTDDILGLAGGELHAPQITDAGAGQLGRLRESVHGVTTDVHGRPEAAHQTRAYREG